MNYVYINRNYDIKINYAYCVGMYVILDIILCLDGKMGGVQRHYTLAVSDNLHH